MMYYVMLKEFYSVDVKLSFKNIFESRLSMNYLLVKYLGMFFIGLEYDDWLLYV